ncbi:unnamed protein product [Hanseniaspora opuntiae]
MFTTLKKLLGVLFSHHEGIELSPSENEDSEVSNIFPRLMGRPTAFSHGENVSIQRQKQMLASDRIDDTTRNQYLKNIISYDTADFEKVSTMIKVDGSHESEFCQQLKRYGYESNKPSLNFHCIYCHLVKVVLYHPTRPKRGQGLKKINGKNQYAQEYEYLAKKIDKVINFSLKAGRYQYLMQEVPSKLDEEYHTRVSKKLTFQNLMAFVNSVDVDSNQDIVQVMLSWVVEDCYKLFVSSDEDELTDDEIEEGFEFDSQSFRLDLEKHTNTSESGYSVGQKTWFARRKEQYDYYNKIGSKDKRSLLKEKNIRPVSHLKIYELLMSGVGLGNKKERLSLEDFMTICFIGWVHDGKWEDGIRA